MTVAVPRPLFSCRAVFFCSAEKPDPIVEAAAAGVDMIIVDLEDEVPPANKATARASLAGLLDRCPQGSALFVRVNSPKSRHVAEDLAAVAGLERLAGVVVPKVEARRDLEFAAERLAAAGGGHLPLVAVLESPAAFLALRDIVEADAPLAGFTMGPFDLTRALGSARRDDQDPVRAARAWALMAGRARGIAVVDGPADARLSTVEKQAAFANARAMGFDGKIVTRLAEASVVARLFTPSDEETRLAEQIVAAFASDPRAELAVLETGASVDAGNLAWAERRLLAAARGA
ncbi:MAG: aldolase/citrate lyase family protein [Hyphomicrobiales bacterium]|nr:aldolase/citrate lyase family protein [Hyphomicrobiales bacterium]